MNIDITTKQRNYSIVLEHGALNKLNDYINKEEHVYIVSDNGVPEKWQNLVMSQFDDAKLFIFEQGEANKNMNTYQAILADMLEKKVTRKDTLIALGGGVVGDMGGFVAASYMRGIKFVNIPTTVLAQIDSSIGGKTAIDFQGVKNCVGAFWQPSLVIIDPDVLSTLPTRQINNGLVEAIKTGLIGDETIFELFEQDDYMDKLDIIIQKSLEFKKKVVQIDENETGIRKILNFGHTYGHSFESYSEGKYLHGECVGMGMLVVLNNQEIKDRLIKVLEKLNLPLKCDYDKTAIMNLIMNDKKAGHGSITIVQVEKIGEALLQEWSLKEIEERL